MSIIDRIFFSPNPVIIDENDEDYDINHTLEDPSPRELDNINEIRNLVRDQSCLQNAPQYNQYAEYSNEVPVRRFTPLPGIPRYNDQYYRTESRLINQEIDTENDFIDPLKQNDSNLNLRKSLIEAGNKYAYLFEADNFYNNNKDNNNKNRTELVNFTKSEANKINHFASSKQNIKKCVHRLPALEKSINHTLQNAMDLDEDLPMNPVNENVRREIKTSPGERLISPIKRPQAPSPPYSFYRRKSQSSDSELEM